MVHQTIYGHWDIVELFFWSHKGLELFTRHMPRHSLTLHQISTCADHINAKPTDWCH